MLRKLDSPWTNVLELDAQRRTKHGNTTSLVDAVRRGADLRILTEFIHGEHIDPTSPSREIIREVCDFQITYLLGDRWVAGIMQQRQPIDLPTGFYDPPSMSYFLYNQDGEQAIARLMMDGGALGTDHILNPSGIPDSVAMPKYHCHAEWDADTNGPSQNFIYDFEVFRYFVRDDWQQVLEHDASGNVIAGSVDALADGFSRGRQIKVALRGLCNDLATDVENAIGHEVFIHAGSCYYYTDQKLFIAGANPLVRVRPGIPLQYGSRTWDVTWPMARTDGVAVLRRVDPLTLEFDKYPGRYAMRWFIR